MNRNDISADILANATKTEKVTLCGSDCTVATMPNGTLALVWHRGHLASLVAICSPSGKYLVDGVAHHSKHGKLRGLGSAWAYSRRGKALSSRGRHTKAVFHLHNAAMA